MGANKITLNTPDGEEVLMDLTGDSVRPEVLAMGETAHNASGEEITGTMPTDVVRYGAQPLTEAQKAQARANINALAKADISLGIASDGFIYIFVNGTPIGTGIPQGQSGDVFGYVDENNTVVLSGNLADGTYSIKYEMDNGKIVDIGNMVLDSNVYYSITSNLTNCTNSNSAKTVVEGESYSATITANSGYELKSVTATMGGAAVTVTSGNINIASVTGNIVITAVAEEVQTEPTNLADPTSADWLQGSRYSVSNQEIVNDAADTSHITNYIPVKKGDVLSFDQTLYFSSNTYGQFAGNANKEKLLIAKISDGGSYWSYGNGKITILHDDVKFMRFNIINVPDKNAVTITKA
jgi:hypothetical protein